MNAGQQKSGSSGPLDRRDLLERILAQCRYSTVNTGSNRFGVSSRCSGAKLATRYLRGRRSMRRNREVAGKHLSLNMPCPLAANRILSDIVLVRCRAFALAGRG